MANKNNPTFNAGWWNCFESFAAELLDVNPNAGKICMNVLKAAGITASEATTWLKGRNRIQDANVENVVKEYWNTLYREFTQKNGQNK